MPRWIDVPAHRVLEIDKLDFLENYDALNADGDPVQFGQSIYRVVRKIDGKPFRMPRYHSKFSDVGRLVYLEEI